MRYKYVVGQRAFMGKKPVTIVKLCEFYGRPSYRVEWTNYENYIEAAILKEEELGDEAW